MSTTTRCLLLTMLCICGAACSSDTSAPVAAYEEVDIETFQDLIGEPHACSMPDWSFDGRCGDSYCFSETSRVKFFPRIRVVSKLLTPKRLKIHQSKIVFPEVYLERIGGEIKQLGEAQRMFCSHTYMLLDAEGRAKSPRQQTQ